MRLLPILLVLALLGAAVPASADHSPYGVTLRAPSVGEAGKPITVEGDVKALGFPATPATIDFFIDGKRVASYLLYLPWYKLSLTLPSGRGEHTIHAVVWSGVSGLRSESPPVVVVAAERPGVPLDVAAAAVPQAHAMQVSWSPPVDDGGLSLQSYRVYRAASGSTTWTLRSTVPANATLHEDPAMPGTTYRYRVAAVSAVGEGAPSAYVEATSGPRVSADAVDPVQIRFRVCWYDAYAYLVCTTAAANSTVNTTSTVWIEPLISGKLHRAGKPHAFGDVSGSYLYGLSYCPPGWYCVPTTHQSSTLERIAAEDGSFLLSGSSWSHRATWGSGCASFDIYATLASSGRTIAEPYAGVKLCQ